MRFELTAGKVLAAAVVALSFWIVHGLLQAVLAAGVTAIASWPLYAAYRARLPRAIGNGGGAAIFTVVITLFVLAPMVFAGWALLGETQALLQGLAAADFPPAPRRCRRRPSTPLRCSTGRRCSGSSRCGMR